MEPTEVTTAAVGTFFDMKMLLTYENVLVVIGAWFTIETLKKAVPNFWRGPVGSRLIVFLPMLVCQVLVWVTVRWQPEATVGERVLLGLVLAFLTAHAHDIAKRLGIHKYVPGFGAKLNPTAVPPPGLKKPKAPGEG